MSDKRPIPLLKAIGIILLSTLLISGTAYLTFFAASYFWSVRSDDPKYVIVAVVQTGPEKEALKTNFLAELLGLSVDRPKNLYKFDLTEGREKLLAFPLIKEATIKRIPPGTLYIDYAIRKPVAFLADVSNTALDAEGRLIPFKPFYSPKKLPSIILGISNEETLAWGAVLENAKSKLAFEILATIGKMGSLTRLSTVRIDVSRAFSPSVGNRLLVVVFEEEFDNHPMENKPGVILTRTLLLNSEDFREGLDRFAVLKDSPDWSKWGQPLVIDLRLPQLAYIQ